MLSQNQVKNITALKSKKFREEYHQFIAEGNKLVTDLMTSPYRITGIYALSSWIVENLGRIQKKNIPVFETLPREMERISTLTTPSTVLAVVEIPNPLELWTADYRLPTTDLILFLDDIRDPGNFGTIIRIADWFGIENIFCSETCVDLYNPKVVQATMGSIARVTVQYADLKKILLEIDGRIQVFGTFLDGENLYGQDLPDAGIILIGNESHGISAPLNQFVSKRIFIPSFGNSKSGKAESLNASVATAIICTEFRRQTVRRGDRGTG